jgi:hypothetical protein
VATEGIQVGGAGVLPTFYLSPAVELPKQPWLEKQVQIDLALEDRLPEAIPTFQLILDGFTYAQTLDKQD